MNMKKKINSFIPNLTYNVNNDYNFFESIFLKYQL